MPFFEGNIQNRVCDGNIIGKFTNCASNDLSPSRFPSCCINEGNNKKTKMTRARALLIALMNEYMKPGYRLTLLEIQKLAYFLQEFGEQLRLDFKKHFYELGLVITSPFYRVAINQWSIFYKKIVLN
jgi:hypothetical protein